MILFVAIWLSLFITGGNALTCLHCMNIAQPRHCKSAVQCLPGEVCGMEAKANSYGETVYDIDCVHDSQCTNTTEGGLSSGGFCRECCSEDLCNAQGCSNPGYPSNRGHVCYNCQMQIHPDTCRDIDICNPGQECDDTDIGSASIIGRRSLNNKKRYPSRNTPTHGNDDENHSIRQSRSSSHTTCQHCCAGDLCNHNCSKSAHTIVPNFCQTSPCDNGRCFAAERGYVCVCDAGYVGTNCSELHTVPNYCHPSPCDNGRCFADERGYVCVCDVGYVGTNCSEKKVKDTDIDCLAIKRRTNTTQNGIYKIKPVGWNVTDVVCDMTTNNGGWTVFQNRYDGSVDFYRNFSSYDNGFGDLHTEFWLGLKLIRKLVENATTDLRLTMSAADSSTAYEVFPHFSISPSPQYTLHIDHGHGTAGDSSGLSYHNHSDFTTYDRPDSYNCSSKSSGGGWWYNTCAFVNFNGHYVTPGTVAPGTNAGLIYNPFTGSISLKATNMMIRRTN